MAPAPSFLFRILLHFACRPMCCTSRGLRSWTMLITSGPWTARTRLGWHAAHPVSTLCSLCAHAVPAVFMLCPLCLLRSRYAHVMRMLFPQNECNLGIRGSLCSYIKQWQTHLDPDTNDVGLTMWYGCLALYAPHLKHLIKPRPAVV